VPVLLCALAGTSGLCGVILRRNCSAVIFFMLTNYFNILDLLTWYNRKL
jgi:hypothetical protein